MARTSKFTYYTFCNHFTSSRPLHTLYTRITMHGHLLLAYDRSLACVVSSSLSASPADSVVVVDTAAYDKQT